MKFFLKPIKSLNFVKIKIFNGKDFVSYFEKKLIFEIENKNFKIVKILKDNYRSSVYLIEIFDKKYIYKIPKEKNEKFWQRILSLFRGSESYRNFISCQNILKNGFLSPKPFLSFTKTFLGFTIYSYFIMEYIDGFMPKKPDIFKVVNLLNEIHKKGFLHGDSQTTNFIIKNDKIYILDSKFNKNLFGNFGKISEFIYLEKNYIDFYKEELTLYDKNTFYYKFCKFFDTVNIFLSKIRKKLKLKIKSFFKK